jgi:hypothetical protein
MNEEDGMRGILGRGDEGRGGGGIEEEYRSEEEKKGRKRRRVYGRGEER